eukprot:2173473-Rhodomonas_salina.1
MLEGAYRLHGLSPDEDGDDGDGHGGDAACDVRAEHRRARTRRESRAHRLHMTRKSEEILTSGPQFAVRTICWVSIGYRRPRMGRWRSLPVMIDSCTKPYTISVDCCCTFRKRVRGSEIFLCCGPDHA